MMQKLLSLMLVFFFTAQTALAEEALVNAGTKVTLLLPNSISSESIEHDGTVTAIVQKDVLVGDQVVIAKGAPALLEVEDVRRTGVFGRSGRLVINGGSVEDVHGGRLPINYSYRAQGKSRRALSIVYTVISVPLIMFIVGLVTLPVAVSIKGKEATMQGGMVFDAFTTTPEQVTQQ